MNNIDELITILEEQLNSIELRSYQKLSIKAIIDAFSKGDRKVSLSLATGTGKYYTMNILVKILLEQLAVNRVLYLVSERMVAEQISERLRIKDLFSVKSHIKEYNNESILVTTYSDFLANMSVDVMQSFDLILCDKAESVKNDKYNIFFSQSQAYFIGLMSSEKKNIEANYWFKDACYVYQYTIEKAINDGYINPRMSDGSTTKFIESVFKYLGYRNIKLDVPFKLSDSRTVRPDLVIEENNELIILEVKTYRGRYNPNEIIRNAINQLLSYKDIVGRIENEKEIKLCLVLLCEVGEDIKEKYFNDHNIYIWDISNIIYICQENKELMSNLGDNVFYSISDILPHQPLFWRALNSKSNIKLKENKTLKEFDEFKKRLMNCKSGKIKKADLEYEKICTDIIKYLFESEFTKISSQHRTSDDVFRMDLLCGLKGSTEFWKFLIRHYNTKFVVFEYKNYGEQISQNLVYITEKYLFNAALRNVAIIVSRKGFDKNAQKAALGCLKENGKLIIDLTDEDLISMLRLKIDGEEASDYILSNVEDILMKVSK
ncbi:DEAD/DEAH box helicase family protein [Clostridium paraputrificum]|uniref:DEAD/DEAH box helicase family protein n=1 Tax=Clostridium paraputrificum TaxID=29363 RepID=UPI003D355188